MPRLNPPPNWPAPPVGWTPETGWTPDPAWGPPPPGWPLWAPEPGDGRRANHAAFGRVGVVAACVYVLLLLAQGALGVASARNAGYALGPVLLSWLLVSVVVFATQTRWRWPGVVGAYVGAWLALTIMSVMGSLGGGV